MDSKMTSPKAVAVYKAVLQLAGRGTDLNTVKVQQIADAAGVGKGTLYEYFPSKEAILRGTLQFCVAQELDALYSAVMDVPDFAGQTRKAMDYIQELVQTRFGAYELVMGVLNRSGAAQPDSCALQDSPLKQTIDNMLLQGYRNALQAGMDPAYTVAYFTYTVISAMAGYAVGMRAVAGSIADQQNLRQITQTMLSRALGVRL